jgi:hypothetical protein
MFNVGVSIFGMSALGILGTEALMLGALGTGSVIRHGVGPIIKGDGKIKPNSPIHNFLEKSGRICDTCFFIHKGGP